MHGFSVYTSPTNPSAEGFVSVFGCLSVYPVYPEEGSAIFRRNFPNYLQDNMVINLFIVLFIESCSYK